jgi:hypothetical protein
MLLINYQNSAFIILLYISINKKIFSLIDIIFEVVPISAVLKFYLLYI